MLGPRAPGHATTAPYSRTPAVVCELRCERCEYRLSPTCWLTCTASDSGAGVSSAAQCDRVPVVTASDLYCHCMQAGRPALWPTCPSRALLCISACADPAM